MATTFWVFHFRWIYWAIGILLLAVAGVPQLQRVRNRVARFAESNFKIIFYSLIFSFFGLASLAKFSQYYSGQLHGQDFWLFADILEQTRKGAPFLTRFAPQSWGWVQHGSVHPMWTWGLFALPSFIGGAVGIALLFHPVMLSLAGWMLGILALRNWGKIPALCFTAAFLCSTQVGKVLMYEVHPEAAYPFLFLWWYWSTGWTTGQRPRWVQLILAATLCTAVKEDSFLVLGPAAFFEGIVLPVLNRSKTARSQVALNIVSLRAIQTGLITIGIILVVSFLQIISVQKWVSGEWGYSDWEGIPVRLSAGVGYFQGLHWSDWKSVQAILSQILVANGGVLGLLLAVGSFFISKPWLSLIVLAPWVIVQFRFWLRIFPVGAAVSLLSGARPLWNYYSAPFLGIFWISAIQFKKGAFSKFPFWALIASLLIGSGGIDLSIPSQEIGEIHRLTQQLLPCLKGRGIVASHLIGDIPLEMILSDRFPFESNQKSHSGQSHSLPDQEASELQKQWDLVDFVVFSPKIDRYELSQQAAEAYFEKLNTSSEWTRIGPDCKPTQSEDRRVVLFTRNNP